YYRSMTPMAPSTQHYASPGHHRYYQSPSNGGSSSQADPYPAQSPYYASQYQRSQTPGINGSEGGQFIPTPSEMYAYSPRQLPTTPHSPPSTDPYSSAQYPPQHAFVSSSRSPELRSSRIATGRPGTSPGSPISSSSGERRFPCEKCGKTFSRSHDRKRHHETQHLPSPVIHRCRYCEKEFSRADSLKRHLDNGCDEMPS
ncbi:Transcriptional regulator MET32, partial [Termitomyces sp. J132]